MSLIDDEDEDSLEELVPLVEDGHTSSSNAGSGSTNRTAATSASSGSSNNRGGDPLSQEHDQADFPVVPSPECPGDDVGWTDYFLVLRRPGYPALGSSSSGSRHREGLSGSPKQEVLGAFDMSERDNANESNANESNEDAQKGAGGPDGSGSGGASGTAAEGAASSDDALLLSVSKEELSSGAKPSQVGLPLARPESSDLFQQLRRAQHVPHETAEVAFSAQQQNDRWIVVILVAGLYVFFYAIGGLAYYLLDIYGYTVDYSGRANHTGNPNTEPYIAGGRQW